MNNTQKTTAVITVAAIAVIGYLTTSKNVTLNHLYERFPDLNQKIAKRAYKKMMRDALAGKLSIDNWSYAQFDEQFLIEYNTMLTK